MTVRPADRIEHVVVLMLENRSFDHLFGFMDFGESSRPLVPNDHANTNPCGDPVEPSATASYCVEMDPPHSFDGVQTAINGGAMNGFVTAHYEKAAGVHVEAIVHPWPIVFAGALAAAIVLALFGLFTGFIRIWAPVLVGLVAALGAGFVQWPRQVLGPAYRERARRFFSLGVLALISIVAVLAWLGAYPLVLVGIGAIFVVALGIGIHRMARSFNQPAPAVEDPCKDIAAPMRCMNSGQIPVLAALAKEFALCTSWYSSLPGETWPNRNFVHAGTSEGDVNIEIGFYDSPTVFDLLDERWGEGANNWDVYYDDGVPQVAVFRDLWQGNRAANWHRYRDPRNGFAAAVARDALPKYAFIEPKHFGVGTNSQHPGNNSSNQNKANGCRDPDKPDWECSDFGRGEQLIADVYETLRSNDHLFAKTLFIVTYDENGGLFDRKAPPRTTAPGRRSRTLSQTVRRWFFERAGGSFDFEELGVRVPALVISPWIRPRTDNEIYDHVSVIATLREIFDLAEPTKEDRPAKSLGHLVCDSDRSRRPDELPDLSQHVRVPAAVAVAEIAAVSSREAVQPTEGFAAQLAQLAELVVAELPPGDGVSLLEADDGVSVDPQGEFVRRFSANSAARR